MVDGLLYEGASECCAPGFWTSSTKLHDVGERKDSMEAVKHLGPSGRGVTYPRRGVLSQGALLGTQTGSALQWKDPAPLTLLLCRTSKKELFQEGSNLIPLHQSGFWCQLLQLSGNTSCPAPGLLGVVHWSRSPSKQWRGRLQCHGKWGESAAIWERGRPGPS